MNDCDYLFTISRSRLIQFDSVEGTPVLELSKMKLKVLWGIGTMS